MRNQWLVYVTVAAISALAGVAIAGPPNSVRTDTTIIVPEATTTTLAQASTTPADDAADPEPVTTADDLTATTTSEPADTTTTTTTSTTTTTVPEPDRAEVVVVAANGAGTGGLATRVRTQLEEYGFERARATDGDRIVDETVVYFAPGFETEAGIVAFLLGRDSEAIAPIADAPSYGREDDDQVVVYLGRDWS